MSSLLYRQLAKYESHIHCRSSCSSPIPAKSLVFDIGIGLLWCCGTVRTATKTGPDSYYEHCPSTAAVQVSNMNPASATSWKNGNSGLSLLFATLCIIDIFGVFPIIALPRSIVQCGEISLQFFIKIREVSDRRLHEIFYKKIEHPEKSVIFLNYEFEIFVKVKKEIHMRNSL